MIPAYIRKCCTSYCYYTRIRKKDEVWMSELRIHYSRIIKLRFKCDKLAKRLDCERSAKYSGRRLPIAAAKPRVPRSRPRETHAPSPVPLSVSTGPRNAETPTRRVFCIGSGSHRIENTFIRIFTHMIDIRLIRIYRCTSTVQVYVVLVFVTCPDIVQYCTLIAQQYYIRIYSSMYGYSMYCTVAEI